MPPQYLVKCLFKKSPLSWTQWSKLPRKTRPFETVVGKILLNQQHGRSLFSVEESQPVTSVVRVRVAGWFCGSRFTRRRWFVTARRRPWSPRTRASSRTATDRRNFASPSEKSSTGSWRSTETAAPVKRSRRPVGPPSARCVGSMQQAAAPTPVRDIDR